MLPRHLGANETRVLSYDCTLFYPRKAVYNSIYYKILDVAAGTGLLGAEVTKHGFENIDSLDSSLGMLKQVQFFHEVLH